jgi:putative peptide zinc metalloprotease protein
MAATERRGMETTGKPKLGGGQEPLALPPVREDLRLYPGPPQRDGSPTWRVLDPVRNSFFEIGWLEFELLARWREHKDAAALAAHVAAETPISPSIEEVREMIGFLTVNQLLAARSKEARDALSQRMKDSKQPWYTELFHHYLFFRFPLFRPDAFLARTVGLVDVFFTRGFVLLVLVLLGIDLYLLSREWYSVADAAARMFTPKAFLYYAIAVTFSKVIHELSHAYAARRYGVRVPTIGIAFLVMWPYLYTDTGETWKLSDRRKQLVIASAGMGAELVLAVFSTLLWALSPEGGAKNVFFVLASSTWVMTLAINLSPFMRFDGYFVLSDLLDFPNLHERGSACARWWLRKTFFGLNEPLPEPGLLPRQRAGLILFAYITWLYRLVVFLGIAVLVYHFFFKLLGIVMFVLELYWFVFRPIWKEMGYLWRSRKAVSLPWRPAVAVLAVAGVVVWVIPVSNEVTAPAILRALHEHSVYAPFPGRITEVRVAELQKVAAGAELLRLEAPDLGVREKKADIAVASARVELARMPANIQLQENFQVLQQRVGQALAEKQAVAEEFSRQQLRSAQDGTIRDVLPDLMVGRWVNTRQLLMRVVSQTEPVIEAFVNEQQVAAISPGQTVHFFPRQPDQPVLKGQVLAVDRAPQKELQRPLLASIYGGEVVVKQGQHGSLVAQDAIYRVMIKPLGNVQKADAVIVGRVRIETSFRFLAENFAYRIISIFIRESGI